MTDLRRLEGYLDQLGIGEGEAVLTPIGDGHSNLTYLLTRGSARLVLRRPPHGVLAPSANDIVREARIMAALADVAVPIPEIVAICEDVEVIGAPFFLVSFVEGRILVDKLGPGFDPSADPDRIATLVVETLAEIHAVDLVSTGLASYGRPTAYLSRQVQRFSQLLEHNATRPLPDLERVRDWLSANLPESGPSTLVHGDYRLGNLMFAPGPRLVAVLDWEMATVGDPLADLGYCTAVWAEDGDEPNPMFDLSGVTRLPAFPSRAELARRYAEITGRSPDALAWYQALALWKAAIFLEGSFGRFVSGASQDVYFASLDRGVPMLGRLALQRALSA